MSMKQLLAEVAAARGTTPKALLEPTRRHSIAHARQEFMFRARQVQRDDGSKRYSLPTIARFLGLKDHTTILHGVRVHEKRLQNASCPHSRASGPQENDAKQVSIAA